MSAWPLESTRLGIEIPRPSGPLAICLGAFGAAAALGVGMHSTLLVVIAAAAAAGLAIVRAPEFLVVLFACQGTLKSLPPFTASPVDLLIVSFVLCGVACAVRIYRDGLPRIPLASVLMLVVSGLLVVAALRTVVPGATYKAINFEIVGSALLFMPLILVRDTKALARLALGFVIVGIMVALAATPSGDPSEPLIIPGGDEITAALFPAFGGLAAISCLAMRCRGIQRLLLLALGIVLLGASVRAGSRGVLLSMGIAVIAALVLLIYHSRRRQVIVSAILIALASLVVIGPAVETAVRGSIDPAALKRYTHLTTDRRRAYLHSRALDQAFAHPLGVGVGTYGVNLPVLQPRPAVPYPHNVIYETFDESGIFAVGALVALMLTGLAAALKTAWRPGCAFCAVGLVFGLSEAFASGSVADDPLLWMTIGISMGIVGGFAERGSGARADDDEALVA
ncbi:MAG TPA: O-antigen ligase family protein [Gaiellales bacterium]